MTSKHNDEIDPRIGRLSGYRCQKCGCCLFINKRNQYWCSECRHKGEATETDIRDNFIFVPVPDDHPHRIIWSQMNREEISDRLGLYTM